MRDFNKKYIDIHFDELRAPRFQQKEEKEEKGDTLFKKDFFGNLCCSFLLVYVGIIGVPGNLEVVTCALHELSGKVKHFTIY